MAVRLCTSAYRYSGADRVDISRAGCDRARKAGGETPGEFLAPSAGLVFPALRRMKEATTAHERQVVWHEYATAYHLEMLATYKARRPEWEAFLQRERATIVCYCVPVNGVLRCHRMLAAGYLARLGATYCGEVNG